VPYFSPDGRHHAFKSSGDDGVYGVNIYDVAAGEYRFLAPVYESNAFLGHRATKNIVWSPDGSLIAFVSAEGETETDEMAPRVVDRLLFRSRTHLSDNRRTHIFVISVDGGEPRQLTTGTYDEHSIDWSPDGDEIVFISNRADDPDDVHKNDVWTVNVASGAIRRITDTPAPEFAPQYSPDGASIAYLGGVRPMNTRDSPMENDHLWVLPAEGGTPTNLTAALDRRVSSFEWSPDGRYLYFRATAQGAVHLFRVPANGGAIDPIVTGEVELTSFAVSPTQDRIVYRTVSRELPAELYVTTHDGSWHRRITHLQAPFTENVSVSVPEEIWYESFDGTRVQGWLTKPNPFEEGQEYPLILTIHGGPHNAYRRSISWTAERLAVTGYSYGGYMTNWIVTQTDRFKAAAAGGSISNLISFYGTSLYHLLIETEFPGELWDNYDLLWDRSPLKHVSNVTTPTLLFHGEDDFDVPITQAEEMFVALRKLGVDAELVRYPGMGHGFSSFANVRDAFGRVVGWFDEHVASGEQ
jgi:dipeptidyl aminopeptidase/acylaminoacyl peptidase